MSKPTIRRNESRPTPRQLEVLILIASGKTNSEIAVLLGISVATVKNHRHNVQVRIDVYGNASLARYAIAHGLIDARDGRQHKAGFIK